MSKLEDMENQGFKVNDRRRFAPDGTPQESERTAESPAEEPIPQKSPPQHKNNEEPDLPADFSGLILSIAAGAQTALGFAPNPMTGKVEKNLSQAKFHVDLLGVLEEKTKNNLTPEEAKLLEAILYDLRMKYLEVKK